MALKAGTRLGPHEITAPIGSRDFGVAQMIKLLSVERGGTRQHLVGFGSFQKPLDHDLLVLERLVVLEEPPNLALDVRWKLGMVTVVSECWIIDVNSNELVVFLAVVAHSHQPDGPGPHNRKGLYRLAPQHERVEGIAVVAVGLRDQAVVGRIGDRAVQDSVDTQQASGLVQLVFHL